MEKDYLNQKLKLLTKFISIDTLLDDILRDDNCNDFYSNNLQSFKIDIINSILSEENIQEEFIKILKRLNNLDYQKYINASTDEQIEIYMKNKKILNDELRYELLNYNIEQEMERLKEYNPYAYKNLYMIVRLAIKCALNYQDYTIEEIPYIHIEETINIIKGFLKKIDKSNSLYHLFEEKLRDESILLWNIFDENEELRIVKEHKPLIIDTKEWKTFNEGDKLYLNAPYESTILDIFHLLHEFIHLYMYNSKENILEVSETETFFEEFPPIYYENKLSQYLEELGFPKEIATIALKERDASYLNDVNSLITLSNLIRIKEHERSITQDDLGKMYNLHALREKMNSLTEEEIKQYKTELAKCGIILDSEEETAKYTCDILNTNIISFEYSEHKRINYVVAKILTEHIIEKTKTDNSLPDKVLYITKKLSTTELEPHEIIAFLSCDDLFDSMRPLADNKVPVKKHKYQKSVDFQGDLIYN